MEPADALDAIDEDGASEAEDIDETPVEREVLADAVAPAEEIARGQQEREPAEPPLEDARAEQAAAPIAEATSAADTQPAAPTTPATHEPSATVAPPDTPATPASSAAPVEPAPSPAAPDHADHDPQ